METEIENIADLRRNARRYQQMLDHPRDACHMLTLLMSGQGTQAHLGNILDQLHIQDLAKAGSRAAALIWQQGGADGKTGTERAAEVVRNTRADVGAAITDAQAALVHTNIVADKILVESMAAIDAGRARRAQQKGVEYQGPERRAGARPEFAAPYGQPITDPRAAFVASDYDDLELRVLAHREQVLRGAGGA